jgi:aarF domain-containing kinase
MTQDALTVLNDIPFTIPPYFALIARAVVTLEGVALQGDPDYGLIMEAYPFVARKLLRDDRPGAALATLYSVALLVHKYKH